MPAHKADNDNRLVDDISRRLDDSIESLDAHTLSKLNQARHRALDSHAPPQHHWLGTGVFAAIFIAVAIGWLYGNMHSTTTAPSTQTVQLSTEDIELIDNLEFVGWLVEQDDAG